MTLPLGRWHISATNHVLVPLRSGLKLCAALAALIRPRVIADHAIAGEQLTRLSLGRDGILKVRNLGHDLASCCHVLLWH